MDLLPEVRLVRSALREAGQLCQAVQQQLTFGVVSKGDRSPVTVADFGSQALICRALHEAFPEENIVAEEDAAVLREATHHAVLREVTRRVQESRPSSSTAAVLRWIDHGNGAPAGQRFWTLDPIDGTRGFLRGQQYAVALARVEGGVVTFGALTCPNLDGGVLLMAARGEGAWCEPLAGGVSPRRIRVSKVCEVSAARLCESVESAHSAHGYSRRLARQLGLKRKSVRLDSQAKYAVVAQGNADIYLRLPTRREYEEKIWDHAAGALILEEAGGRVTDLRGTVLDFAAGRTLARNRGIVATNGYVHADVLAALMALPKGRA